MQKIDELKAEQEKHRQQMKENRAKVMERKRRAHRLIVRGAIAESLIENAPEMSDEEFRQKLFCLVGKKQESGDNN